MNTIWVTFQRKGFHKYPLAPSNVAYLATEHRHLFKFKVSIEVFHDDREIEFHTFLNWIEDLYQGALSLDYKSCEMICNDLSAKIMGKYPDRYLQIDVSEDGECGAVCEYNTIRKFSQLELGQFGLSLNMPQTPQTIKETIIEQQISTVNATPMLDPLQATPVMREEIGTPFVAQSVGPVEGQIATGTVLTDVLPTITQQTLNADVLLPNTQTVVTETVYPEGFAIPAKGLILGRNSEGHHVKYENGIAYISTDGQLWSSAWPGANIVMVPVK